MGVTHPFRFWSNAALTGGIATTSEQDNCMGYHFKTVYLLSNQNGSLDIEVDVDGEGNWQTLKTALITANTLYVDLIEYDFCFIRLAFTPDVNATVNAWIDKHGE